MNFRSVGNSIVLNAIVKMFSCLRRWWQVRTGEEETPFDGDLQAWGASLIAHVAFLVLIATLLLPPRDSSEAILIDAPVEIEEVDLVEDLPQAFTVDTTVNVEIGAQSINGLHEALAAAPQISDTSDAPELDPTFDVGPLEVQQAIEAATGPRFQENLLVVGATGVGTTGAAGAIDRITQEILMSLEDRKTLVVWLFDQSASLERQRAEIHGRFDRIYEELGVIEASGNPAFKKHNNKPLLTSVVAFGEQVTFRVKTPTDDLEEVKKAIVEIERDASGVENVFAAVGIAAQRCRVYRTRDEETGEPERNVMLVVVSDEAGSDVDQLEPTIQICRRFQLPVYVIGVPAPFGRKETMLKWIDPDPQYDQSPAWGPVNQGPESLLPERLRLHFALNNDIDDSIDSGFGPYALTRLSYQTGGIYFSVHPNRKVGRSIGRRETADLSAHFRYFFDPQVMRKYRPDYVSVKEYQRRLQTNQARLALVEASKLSWLRQMESPRVLFPKQNEAALANALSEAQKVAAKLEPQVHTLFEVLKAGEVDRPKENVLRWQAGYDLAMGRLLAVKVRTETYNAMLAQAKRGMKFEDSKNDTWQLKPNDEVSIGSQYVKLAKKSREYLDRVVQEHPGTPWALLAKRELTQPVSWKWFESYTGVNAPPPPGVGNGTPPPGRDDQLMKIKRKPKRKVPRL